MELNTFQLFDVEMTALSHFKNNEIDFVVAGGHDTSNPQTPVVKILKLNNMDEQNYRPITIAVGQSYSKITSISVLEGANSLIVGLSGGEVYYFKSDILKHKNEKGRLVYEAQTNISGLALKSLNKTVLAIIATESFITTISVSGTKDKEERKLSDEGVKTKCWTQTDKSQFVVGRKDGVFVYEHDGLGPFYPFEGEKVSVNWFKGKLVIAAKDQTNRVNSPLSSAQMIDMTTISIYDVDNKYVGFSKSFPQLVSVVCEWGSVFVLASKGEQLYQLTEKDTQSKLDILFKKNHFQMAIDLAQSSQYNQEGVIDIIRQYADHLYGKGDFNKAIIQYAKTIGYLEPSYIIRKFLDSQRIVNLTDYLQDLHKSKLANEDHTTLLLNCYTKLKDEERLKAFFNQPNVEFDIDIGIKVLRQSGYYNQALELCDKHAKHEDYLKIQLEHLKNYSEGLSYIEKLDNDSAIFNLKKYGKLLMTNIPEKTVEFLKKLCKKYDPVSRLFLVEPAQFIQIFINNSAYLIDFLEHIHMNGISESKLISNTLLELYIDSFSKLQKKDSTSKLSHGLNNEENSSLRSISIQERKALEFLKSSNSNYDMNLALNICQLHQFKAGLIYLYEKNNMHQKILQFYMDQNDYPLILDTCKRYGTQDTSLWIQALQYFSKREEYNCKEYITQILGNIERYNLLTPLMVIKILSQNSTLTIDTVKEYLLKRMKREEKEIEEGHETVNKHLKSILELKNQIDQLKTEPIIFQANKCELCGEELNFPSVHCLCNHSFHAECFESHSADDSCPTCAVENSNFMNLIKQNEEMKKNLHDAFHKELERNFDKFEVIADYLGKGIFNKVTLLRDQIKRTN